MTTFVDESSTAHARLVLGVDGGGTKTLCHLAMLDKQASPQVIGRGVSGSSNKVAVGPETAFQNLADAIEKAFADANRPPAHIGSAVLALAGSGTDEAKRQVLDFVHQRFQIGAARVIHDGQAVLEAGTPDGWGIALIAGTGAVAYGANQAGDNNVVGGWGYWFGDEGSAYWLGQSALRAVSQATDGRGETTSLTEAILSRVQTQDPRQILTVLAAQGDVRLEIAKLADLVCTTAEQGDAVATSIVDAAAQHLGRHITCLAEQLWPGATFPLALAGGVLDGSQFVRDKLMKRLESAQIRPASVEVVTEPVAGSVKLAARQLTTT